MESKAQAIEALLAEEREARRRGPRGSRLPAETQAIVADHLRAGCSMAETARRTGVTRDRVRTIWYALHGLTLPEYRRLKARLRV